MYLGVGTIFSVSIKKVFSISRVTYLLWEGWPPVGERGLPELGIAVPEVSSRFESTYKSPVTKDESIEDK